MKIISNPNQEIAKAIRKQIKENEGYCPSAFEKTDATKCVCEVFRDQIRRGELGKCHCGLWEIVEEPQNIKGVVLVNLLFNLLNMQHMRHMDVLM